MTIDELEQKIELKIKQERAVTTEVVALIAMAEETKLYALRGYPSLFEWLTQKYKYSEGSANRRISAARLLKVSPEIKTKLENGNLNLTTMAKAQSIMRAKEKVSKTRLSNEVKFKALEKIQNQSTLKAEQTLLNLFPEAASQVKQDRIQVVDDLSMRLNANIPNEVQERFEQVRDLLSNILPNASFIEAADYLFKKLLHETAVAGATAAKQCVNSNSAKPGINNNNRTVTPRTKRIVLQKRCCTYKDPISGKICGSRYQLQVDHRVPKALGGSNHRDNLRVLCATHNRLMAELTLGKSWANSWRKQQQI